MKTLAAATLITALIASPVYAGKKCEWKNINGKWRGNLVSAVYPDGLYTCSFRVKGGKTLRGAATACDSLYSGFEPVDLGPVELVDDPALGCAMRIEFGFSGYPSQIIVTLDGGRTAGTGRFEMEGFDAGTVTLTKN